MNGQISIYEGRCIIPGSAIKLVTIQDYGDYDIFHPAQRADELMAEGDMDGRRVWHRIERAIDELQRTAPGRGEGVH